MPPEAVLERGSYIELKLAPSVTTVSSSQFEEGKGHQRAYRDEVQGQYDKVGQWKRRVTSAI